MVLVLVIAVYGVVVLHKSCWLQRRQGDVTIFCRAGWAAAFAPDRLYTVTDHNGWHYNCSPGFAVFLAPFAEPPPGPSAHQRFLPYPVSVVGIYLVNVVAVLLSVHLIVSACERVHGVTGAGWWRRRVLPALACAVPIAVVLHRSQVQFVLLLLIAGAVAALQRGRRFAAGLLLSATWFKVFPAYLVLVPLWRRDGRCLAGVAAGLVLWGAALPAALYGPDLAAELTRQWAGAVILPGLGLGEDASRDGELLAANATGAQCFQVVWHKTLYIGQPCPPKPGAAVRLAHLAMAVVLTACAWRRSKDEAALVGTLTLIMVLIAPTGHPHYLTLALPLLAYLHTREEGGPGRRVIPALLAAVFVANLLVVLPGLEVFRSLGAPMYTACAALAAAWWGQPAPGLTLRLPTMREEARAA